MRVQEFIDGNRYFKVIRLSFNRILLRTQARVRRFEQPKSLAAQGDVCSRSLPTVRL